jgi:hypothetical protein
MALYDEAKHRRLHGKFATKPLSPADKKSHAVVPVKRTGIIAKKGGTSTVGDLHRSTQKKGRMNTGKKPGTPA